MNPLTALNTKVAELWNHTTLLEIHKNGGFLDFEGNYNELCYYIGKSFAEIPGYLLETARYFVVDAFLADIIADEVNGKVCKRTPVYYFTSDFDFTSSDTVPVEMSLLVLDWATDHETRLQYPHLGEILALGFNGDMSICPFEIDRYLSILQELQNPAHDFDLNNYTVDRLIKCISDEMNVELTPSQINELRNKNPVLLARILCLGLDYDLSFYLTVVNALYDMHMQTANSSQSKSVEQPQDVATNATTPIVINLTININL